MRPAALLALALAIAPGLAAAAAIESYEGLVQARDAGCGAAPADTAGTEWPGEALAMHRALVWLTARETVRTAVVPVEREGDQVRAWIEVDVAPVVDGEPVPTCIRAVTVELQVPGLTEGDYEWSLLRGPRPATPDPGSPGETPAPGDATAPVETGDDAAD